MKATVVTLVVALLGVIAFSVIGQEEPLPRVIPKADVDPGLVEMRLASPTVVLAAEPVHEYQPPTLIDAARNNDYVTFDALFTAAQRRGDDVSQFETLHDLWTYSVTDPIGAFYGRDIYERLARAFPGYARYIEPYAIVDSRGNVFYPTSETRAFLIDRVIEGRTPRVQIAERAAAPAVVEEDESVALSPVRAKAPARQQPVQRAAAPSSGATGRLESRPHVEPVAVEAPPVETVETPIVVTPAPAPVQKAPVKVAAARQTSPLASRGLLLMIGGLVAIGLVALILRARDDSPAVVTKPTGNVEPIRKPPPSQNDSRATGSHG